MISGREGKALAETAKLGAELYLAEKRLAVHAADREAEDHPLGHDGGVKRVPLDPLVEQHPEENQGYDTVVPAPEDIETAAALVARETGGDRRAMVGRKLNAYPTAVGRRMPVPERVHDANGLSSKRRSPEQVKADEKKYWTDQNISVDIDVEE
jgi:hypothetical protein